MNYREFKHHLPPHIFLVAVSKTKPIESIMELYNEGQRDFGENKVQELLSKYEALPKDIRWHLIGHLQTNKVKYILDKIALIQSVDSEKLIEKIQAEALKKNLNIEVLLQVKIASEDTKYGLSVEELDNIIKQYKGGKYPNIFIKGFMGMATLTDDSQEVTQEFQFLYALFEKYKKEDEQLKYLSMGMSDDYQLAIANGSNMIRIGSLLFGTRKT